MTRPPVPSHPCRVCQTLLFPSPGLEDVIAWAGPDACVICCYNTVCRDHTWAYVQSLGWEENKICLNADNTAFVWTRDP